MQKNLIPLTSNQLYHIYNRGIARQSIFFNDLNYGYFLKLFFKQVSPIANIYTYCLMQNHFHFLIGIKSEENLPSKYQQGSSSLSLPFSHWFNAYTQKINHQENRTGGLFHRPFRRVLIENEAQLLHTIMYIHGNPKHHQVLDDFQSYPYSSYGHLLSDLPSPLMRDEVMDFFGGKANFISSHESYHDYLDELM